jgi:hypothetical protein
VSSLRRDPAAPGLLLFAAFAGGGLAAVVIGWRITALERFVPLQAPAGVSAGVGGIVLAGVGLALLNLQLERRAAARRAEAVDQLLDEAAQLALVGARLRDVARARRQR